MELGSNDIHVWFIDLNDPAWDAHASGLSNDELVRASHYATHRLQQQYRRCRASLRALLGPYGGQAAAELRFQSGPFGKPALTGVDLEFNLSHSGGYALVAVARQPLGIDLELLHRPDIDPDELIPLVCHPSEARRLRALPAPERHRRFYCLWTRKEAYCKALGLGLQRDMTALRAEDAHVIDEHRDGAVNWFVQDLRVTGRHAASLCASSATARVQLCLHTAISKP